MLKVKIQYDQYLQNIQFYDIVKCFDKLWLRDVMYDLGNNGVTGRLDRIIFLLNSSARITIKRPYGTTEAFEFDELVRQGSVLGAAISANSLETVVKDTQHGIADTTIGNMFLYPLCFVDDIVTQSWKHERTR